MTTPSSGGSSFENGQAGLGGADAVPDTPDAPAHGTEPGARRKGAGAPTARVGSGGAPSIVVWVVGLLVLLAIVAYMAGAVFLSPSCALAPPPPLRPPV